MKIIIDADACPVVDITVNVAKEREIECIIVCDNTHTIERDGAKTIVVDKGADSADCRIANLTEKGDVIVRKNKEVTITDIERESYMEVESEIIEQLKTINSGLVLITGKVNSGKTTTLVESMKLIPNKEKVLFVAFNKAIEQELSSRLKDYTNVMIILYDFYIFFKKLS